MTPQDRWRSEYEQEWVTSPADRHLYDLAMEYHTRCELYDRTVCGYRDESGEAIPTDYRESALISRNARAVIKDIVERERIEREQLMKAIREHSWHFDPRSIGAAP